MLNVTKLSIQTGKFSFFLENSVHIGWNEAAVFEDISFIRTNSDEHIGKICSSESTLLFISICSVRIRSRKEDIFEKPLQLNSNPSVKLFLVPPGTNMKYGNGRARPDPIYRPQMPSYLFYTSAIGIISVDWILTSKMENMVYAKVLTVMSSKRFPLLFRRPIQNYKVLIYMD